MIIDDEEDIAYLVKQGLELGGHFDVDIFNDPIVAIQELKPLKYELILIDVVMPEIDGFDTYRLIKEKDSNSVILFLSAAEYNEEDIRNKLPDLRKQKQKTIMIRKPVKLKELANQINKIISENIN